MEIILSFEASKGRKVFSCQSNAYFAVPITVLTYQSHMVCSQGARWRCHLHQGHDPEKLSLSHQQLDQFSDMQRRFLVSERERRKTWTLKPSSNIICKEYTGKSYNPKSTMDETVILKLHLLLRKGFLSRELQNVNYILFALRPYKHTPCTWILTPMKLLPLQSLKWLVPVSVLLLDQFCKRLCKPFR